jgi:Lar family restriction alleviation protein
MKEQMLKGCPFCGGKKCLELDNVGYDIHPNYAVCCDNCETTGPIKPTKIQAIRAWNNRLEEKRIQKAAFNAGVRKGIKRG